MFQTLDLETPRRSLQWEIGGISIRITSQKGWIPSSWSRCFPQFIQLNAETDHNDVQLELHPVTGQFHPSFSRKPGLQSVPLERNGSAIKYRSYNFSGKVWSEANKYAGCFFLTEDQVSFWRVLLTVIAHMLYTKGKFLLHASGVLVDRQAWLFSGKSGSGKTTIATELVGHGKTFSMDRVILARDEFGGLLAYPTPFSDIEGVSESRNPAPVAGIAFIEQARETALMKLEAIDAIRCVLQNTSVLPGISPEHKHSIFQFVTWLTQVVCCYKLKFTRHAEFWHLLKAT